jgi:hypothetical protein
MTLVQAAVGLGCAVGFLAVIYGPWQWICTDITRQILFEKRDALFDLAHSGKLSFESREYRTIRSSLQANIRFAHELTLPRFFVLLVALGSRGDLSQPSNLSRALDEIADPETRSEVRRLVQQATRAMLVMMIVKSPPALILLTLSGLVLALVRRAREAAVDMERRAGEVIQVEAETAPISDDAAPALAA